MSVDSRYGRLKNVLVRLLEKSRGKGTDSSANFDLDDALLELEVWHDLVFDSLEAMRRDAEADRLTSLALDTALDACETLEIAAGTGESSIDERYALLCPQVSFKPCNAVF